VALVSIDVPRPYEVSPGLVRGHVAVRVTAVDIYTRRGATLTFLGRRATTGGRFRLAPGGLKPGDQTIVVVALEGGRRVGSSRVTPVYGLPGRAFEAVAPRTVSGVSQRSLRRIHGPGATAVWARGMASGVAASYNAGARFTAASTLKLAILMTALAHWTRDPTKVAAWGAMRKMIIDSDNEAADDVEVALGGSTSAASGLVNAFCRRMRCRDTDMYGGYVKTPAALALRHRDVPPVDVDDPPVIQTYGKHTTAHDLGVLLAGLLTAAGGHGRAVRLGISPREARVALWLLVHARYPGVVRRATSVPVAHKAGWLAGVEHDAALVFTRRGTVVLVVMSQGGAAGPAATGAYARRVAGVILQQLP
jgi:hypothetical protein